MATTPQKPYSTLEPGDYVWIIDEPYRFTVAWCHPDYDGLDLYYPPEAGKPDGQRYCVCREDIKRASRPPGKPYVPPTPFEPPF